MNRGLGFMDQHDNGAAAKELKRATAAAPRFYPAQFDLGLALTNLREDPRGAEEALRAAIALEPGEPAPWFVLGFLLSRVQQVPRITESVEAFRRAVLLAPRDPDARLGLGVTLAATDRPEEGVREIEEAVRLAPHLGPAIYLRAMAYQRAGRAEEALAELRRYKALEQARKVDVREEIHGYEGRLAEPVRDFARWLPPAPPPGASSALVLRRVEEAFEGGPASAAAGAALALGDLDGDGVLDVVLGGVAAGWRRGLRDCRFGPPVRLPVGATASGDLSLGDLDGDGRLDVVIAGAGIVWAAGAEPRLAAHPGLEAPGRRLLADLDGDGDLDLVAGRAVLLNDGTGRLSPSPAPEVPSGPRLPAFLRDLDGDRFPDLVFLPDSPGGRGAWLPNLREGVFGGDLRPLPADRSGALPPPGVLALGDVDADGIEDAVVRTAAGGAALRRGWRAPGGPAADEVLCAEPAESAVFADLDGDGDLDLVLAAGGRLSVFRNDGDAGPRMLALSLKGIVSPNGPRYGLSNVRGVGTEVTVSVGRRCTTRWMGLEDAPTGKPPPDVLWFPVGPGGKADLVSLRWTDGVLQGEMDLPAGRRTIEERQRKANW
jgi:Tfp pilus assembly protein PilF